MVVFYFTKMIKIKLKDNFTYKKLKENFVLLNNETGKYLMLNEKVISQTEISEGKGRVDFFENYVLTSLFF